MADLIVGAIKFGVKAGVAAKKAYDDSPVSDVVEVAGAAARAHKANQQQSPQAAQQPMQQTMPRNSNPLRTRNSLHLRNPIRRSFPLRTPTRQRNPTRRRRCSSSGPSHHMAQVVPANAIMFPMQPMHTTLVVQACQHHWNNEYTWSGRLCCCMLLPLSLLNLVLCCGKTACSHQRCTQCRLRK